MDGGLGRLRLVDGFSTVLLVSWVQVFMWLLLEFVDQVFIAVEIQISIAG